MSLERAPEVGDGFLRILNDYLEFIDRQIVDVEYVPHCITPLVVDYGRSLQGKRLMES